MVRSITSTKEVENSDIVNVPIVSNISGDHHLIYFHQMKYFLNKEVISNQ